MKNILVENRFGHGAKSSIAKYFRPKDKKLQFKGMVGRSPAPFDWKTGYDVEKEIGNILGITEFKLPVKHQGSSSSCGGQLEAELESINEVTVCNKFIERSAKDAYSHIKYPGGGTTSMAIEADMITRGVARETLVSSYQNGNPPTEAFMIDHSYETPEIIADAKETIDTGYVGIDFSNINEVAIAIRDYKAIGLQFRGKNNGTWLSDRPALPNDKKDLWSHFVLLGKAKLNEKGEKEVWFLNSWGKDVGNQGWQAFNEAWIKSGNIQDMFGVLDHAELAPKIQQNPIQAILLSLRGVISALSGVIKTIQDVIIAISSLNK